MVIKTLTVFTPTYNRAHTLGRVYQSLCAQTCRDFEWLVVDDGSTDGTGSLVQSWMDEGIIPISYIYKENGGLYTGYNTAYAAITTELNVCIDSDDAMPPDAVETIVRIWKERGSERYAGITGLDCDMDTLEPIGGRFPEGMTECFFPELYGKRIHRGDSKQVMRTDLMKEVAPQEGFPGEKNFNPVYMLLQVTDRYPVLLTNECFCLVQYQTGDSMSQNIYRQYFDSPRSFAKMRRLEMTLKHTTTADRYRSAIHYVAERLLAKEDVLLKNSPGKGIILLAAVPGYCLYLLIRHKGSNGRVDKRHRFCL
jgi:glycosyltransferase involved in cell wall biosynthesis